MASTISLGYVLCVASSTLQPTLFNRARVLTYLFLCSNNATYNSIADAMLPHTQNTYWHEFHEISKYNIQLNYFEKLWAAWYAFMGNDVLATGIMSFLMHELVYFGRSLPWMIVDRIPALNKYKIQSVSWQCRCGVDEAG